MIIKHSIFTKIFPNDWHISALQDLCHNMINLDKEKEGLIQEWAKIRAEQQQELDPLDTKIVKLNQQASALMGEDYSAADTLLAQVEVLESQKKALAAKHTEVKSQWAQKMASKRTEHLKAAVTLPSQMAEARNAFIGVAEKTTSAPAAPKAATEDPAITAKREALLAEVRKCMDAKSELSAAQSQATKNDDELLATNNLTMDEYIARKDAREKAFEDIIGKLKDARQAQKAFLDSVKSAPATAAAAAAAPPSPHVFKVPDVPKTTPRKVMPTFSLGPSMPPAPPATPASLGESSISSDPDAGDVTAALKRKEKRLAKQEVAFLNANLKKKKKDQYEQPLFTGITKIRHPLVVQLISECMASNKFNTLTKPVLPRNGDVYIYQCGAKQPVIDLDQQTWKHEGTQIRRNVRTHPGREFFSTYYIKSVDNREEKKYIWSDEANGVQVLFYRLVNVH